MPASLEGRELAPNERLRAGWPRLSLLPWAMALPMTIAGPLRFVFGLSLGWGFVAGALLTLLALVPLVPSLRARTLSAGRTIAAWAILVVVAVFAVALPYNHHFHGLPQYLVGEWGGADGGYHVMNYMDFTRRTHNVYGGFVSMYSFWDATRRLGSTHLLIGLNVCFAWVRIVAVVVPCTIALATLWRFRDDAAAWWSGAAACLVAALAVQDLVVLPLENFHLMGGFWPHLFGLTPLLLLWMVDALVRHRLTRLALTLGCIVLYRYTYGLNLADVTAAVGLILVLDALARRPSAWWVRAALVACALAGFWASRLCYRMSLRLFSGNDSWGWIVDHDVAGAQLGMGLVAVALAASVCAGSSRDATSSGITRALRFPLFCVAADVVILALIRRLPPQTTYYFQKYDFHALVLASGAVVVAAAFAIAGVVAAARSRAAWARAAALLLIAGAGVTTMHRAIASYETVFREQVYGGPYSLSYPWVVPAVVRRIDNTLEQRHARFGGFLTSHYASRVTTNALFDHGDRDWMRAPKPDESPGHCVFWDADRSGRFDFSPGRSCETYVQIPFGKLTICSRCY